MDLQDQVVVITGGGSGMGAASASALAQKGAKVVLLDTNLEKAEALADSLNGMALACDVSDAKSAEKAINAVVAKYGSISGCVNCAGIAPAKRVVGKEGPHSLDLFNQVVSVNLVGTFNLMRLCAAQMVKQEILNEDGERGVIINTASVAAFEGQIGQVAYSASKGGVVSMTLPAAREFGRFGIRVMTVAPGIIDTPMMAAMPEEVQHSLGQTVTFPKRMGDSEEYASLVATIFKNRYLNGSVIRLDGGIRMSDK